MVGRGDRGTTDRGTIVVGVDGSPSSVEALRWAARQAELTGADLQAVTAWHMPTTYGWMPPVADVDWPGRARTTLGDALGKAFDDAPPPQVRRQVVEGHSVRALVKAADGAELLVVGSRGRGEFAGMVLGSVAQHVVAHAPCPVVVIPPGPAAGGLTPDQAPPG